MKKYYLVNGSVVETVYYKTSAEALKESQRRNNYERNANWKAYDEKGDAIYGICICR